MQLNIICRGGRYFAAHTRGRVMGMIQMGFGLSQVLGIPLVCMWLRVLTGTVRLC